MITGDFTERPKPPMDWFSAFGTTERGIDIVHVNPNFLDIEGGKVKDYYRLWSHLTGNSVSSDAPLELIKQVEKTVVEAESFILEKTGFSVRDISNMESDLTHQYSGNKSAPIETNLY